MVRNNIRKKSSRLSSLNNVFILIGILVVAVIIVFAIMFSGKKPDKESLNFIDEKTDSCKLNNPQDTEQICKDRAYFALAVAKGIDVCDKIKDSNMKDKCERMMK